MNRVLILLLSRIYTRCNYLKEMLDFIQADSAFKKREELLKKLNLTAREAPAQLESYRNAIMDLQVRNIVSDYILCKHRFARWSFNRMLRKIYTQFEKATKEETAKTNIDEKAKK